jgi:hypothetical protein
MMLQGLKDMQVIGWYRQMVYTPGKLGSFRGIHYQLVQP